MSRVLSRLLDKPEEFVAGALAQLEHRAGHPSEDARLVAESSHKVRTKIAELGLDSDDTTGEELFHALLSRFAADAARIDRALGVQADTPAAVKTERAISLVRHITKNDEAWILKPAAIKRILRLFPPKRLMRLLGYRSLESMLKHEDNAAVLSYGLMLELPNWQKQILAKLEKLNSADYELGAARIVVMSEAWDKLPLKGAVISDTRSGVIAISPGRLAAHCTVLNLALVILDDLEAISLRSRHQHISVINPALNWWRGMEHLLAWNDGQPVSLNFKDVAQAHLRQVSYEQRPTHHAAGQLWDELLSRYKQKIGELPEELSAIEDSLGDVVPKELALEYSEAD